MSDSGTRCAIRVSERRFLLLAPADGGGPEGVFSERRCPTRFEHFLGAMQRLRGRIYLADGAITKSELSADGRHELSSDRHSWHLLLLGEQDSVLGCMRYMLYGNRIPFSRLGIWSSALAQCDRWSTRLRCALNAELAKARQEAIGFAEVGGWALDETLRCSTEALRMVLATYGLSQLLGDALGISTATTRNGSAKILRRIGGRPIMADDRELPPYFDPQYNCDMELLRFDSRNLNPRYCDWINELRSELLGTQVICATRGAQAGKIFPAAATRDLAQAV